MKNGNHNETTALLLLSNAKKKHRPRFGKIVTQKDAHAIFGECIVCGCIFQSQMELSGAWCIRQSSQQKGIPKASYTRRKGNSCHRIHMISLRASPTQLDPCSAPWHDATAMRSLGKFSLPSPLTATDDPAIRATALYMSLGENCDLS